MWFGRLNPFAVLAWAAVTMLMVVALVWASRPKGALLRRRWFLSVPVGGIPCACLLFSLAVFGVLRAHPLLQYNAPGDLGGWSIWARAWLFLALAPLGAALVSLVLTTLHRKDPRAGLAWRAAALANLVSTYGVWSNIPSC